MPGTTQPDPDQQATQQDQHEGESVAAVTEAQVQAWASLLQQCLATGRQLSTLLRLELRLALADGQRLFWVGLAMVPVIVLAWLGISALLAWLVFLASGSVSLSLAGFVLVQLTALLLLWRAARNFQHSLGLPATRRQLRALTGTDNTDEQKTTDS